MATVRKRSWTNKSGTYWMWIVTYNDQDGTRRQKTCTTQREAKDFLVRAGSEVKAGIHTPDSKSVTVSEAAAWWLDACALRVALPPGDENKLDYYTLLQYRTHAQNHIAKSAIARIKLSRLTPAMVEGFRQELLKNQVSGATARKILTGLKAILAHAQRHGLCVGHVRQFGGESPLCNLMEVKH